MGEAIVPIVLSVASTAVSIYSSVSAGKKEEHAEKNVARQLRQQAIQKAEDTAKEHRRILAIQRAKYGASGLGSPLEVQMESLRESEEQLRRIREGGAFEAEVHEEAGEEALKSGYLRGVGAGLAGTTSVVKTGQGYNWW